MTKQQGGSHTPLVAKLRSPATVFYEYAADDGALLREAADTISELLEALDSAEAVIDYAASILWNCRPEGRQARPGKVDAALRQFRAAILKARPEPSQPPYDEEN